MTDRFFIAPYDAESGLQSNVKPWLIPDTAFSTMNNAYVFRGRVRKRFGSRWTGNTQLNSRLRAILVPVALTVTTPINVQVGQIFSIGTDIFTVNNITPPYPINLLSTSGVTAQLISANQVTFSAIASTVFWYPALPVMGLLTYENGQLDLEPTIAFDTRYAYQYSPTTFGWDRLAAGSSVWQGSDSNFFWGTNWTGANAFEPLLFVTNFDQLDPNFMRYWNGATWTNFRPQIDATPNYLNNARLLVTFRNRLVAFNTWEGPSILGQQNYPNRCRYSQVGSPLDANAWRQDIPGRGSAIDAPTTEAIVTCEFIKDRLIVYFERSTYELAYTGNQAYPFVWNKINTELGAESTNSIIPMDKVTIGAGNTGIHACNGGNVERIDDRIPTEVFDIHNNDQGVFRVYGIRDYFVEMLYWTFPDQDASNLFPYPNRIFVYNYKTGTWSFNDDSFTCFGYFFQPVDFSPAWDSVTVGWDDDDTWDSGNLQSQFRQVIAGNQEGYIVIVDAKETTNAPALQIDNITVAINTITIFSRNHNLRTADYVLLQSITGSGTMTSLNNKSFYAVVDLATPHSFTISFPSVVTGTYTGGGTIARISQIDIRTKEYNFYAKEGRNVYVSKVDFMVDATDVGEIQVNYFVSTSKDPLLQDSIQTDALMGNGNLETFPYPTVPFESNATRLIHPVYLQSDGEFVQLQLIFNDIQMTTITVNQDGTLTGPALEDFQLHFMCIYAQRSSFHFR